MQHLEVAVVGGGQAGLSASWYLKGRGIDHVVLERHQAVYEWKHRRWDSFCLVTPNWQCQLPGFPYAGADPDGFMGRDELVGYLEDYVRSFEPPLVEGVTVRRLWPLLDGGFHLETSEGSLRAGQVIVATGPYQRPRLGALASRLRAGVVSLHSCEYRRPDQLPAGGVLVVGTGQSGCQIAEDLHLAGRRVHLSVGSAPRVARRYRGKDVVAWLDEMGYYRIPVDDHPLGQGVRHNANHYVTGRDGGHDIDLRAFATEGMELYGRLVGVDDDAYHFSEDLGPSLDHADSVAESIKDSIDAFIERSGQSAPAESRYTPVWSPPAGRRRLGTGAIASVVWATGFRPDFAWLEAPVFDPSGQVSHRRGVSPVAGLYFLGLPWLHTWGSARFSGIAADAGHVTSVAAARVAPRWLRSA